MENRILCEHSCHTLSSYANKLDISLLAYTSTTMTIVAIAQEFLYLNNWYRDQVNAYEVALKSAYNPPLALGPQSLGVERALYWVQIYLGNCCAIIIACWAVNLAINSWNWRSGRLWDRRHRIRATAKVGAFLIPAVTVPLRATIRLDTCIGVAILLDYLTREYFH